MSNEYDVHFSLNGYFRITATSEEDAREKTNAIINARIEMIEELLCAGVEDDDYTTDVILSGDEEDSVNAPQFVATKKEDGCAIQLALEAIKQGMDETNFLRSLPF